MLFGISNGILSALIFLFKSEEARRRWKAYFYPPDKANFDDFVEPPIQLDFEDDYESNTNFTSNTAFTDKTSVSNASELGLVDLTSPAIFDLSPLHTDP
jgi:hypothetical protein